MLSYNLKDNETIQLLNNKYFINIEEGTPITFYTNLNDNNLIKKYYKDVELSNEIDIDDNQDLIIYGIGIVRFKNKTKVKTNIPLESIEIRNSIFGGYYE